MIKYSIFIVDDEQSLAKAIALNLQKDYHAKSFTSAEKALEAIKDDLPDIILLDIGLPGMNGIKALGEIKKCYPEIVVIMITAFEEIETVVSALRLGAYDYIVKPLQMDALKVTIENAIETIRLRKEVQTLQANYLKENLPFWGGKSKAILNVMEFVENVAKSPDTPILILGESGTGKELIAKAIHYRSPNFKGPLVTVNCAAIPKNLLESELFGYEKGAFTGADHKGKKGLVEQAENGTLFLDEIGDLSLEVQAKLLRFIESGEFYKVGGTQKTQVQTRIISATNKNLGKMIEDERFREDLYFRIGVIKVQVPSLNERSKDILPMAKYFVIEFSKKFGKKFIGITSPVERALKQYHWRGNVRELKNLIERATLISKGPEITLEDLGIQEFASSNEAKQMPDKFTPVIPSNGVSLPFLMESIEKQYIEEALRITEGNETKAAELLQIKYSTLRYRRRKLKITS